MNEFEWRRQLRGLRQPQIPPRDLWPSIEAALTRAEQDHESPKEAPVSAPPRVRRLTHWLAGTAVAASLLLAGNAAWRARQAPVAAPTTSMSAVSPTRWKPSDPRLAGAAIELDAAQMELKLALEQAPDSPVLQRLLDRTEMQQTKLRRLANQAG